jgi:hypothetical protein
VLASVTPVCDCYSDQTSRRPQGKIIGLNATLHVGKGWSLNLVNNVLWMANTYAGVSVAAVKLYDPSHKVMTWDSGSGGAWGRRGVAVDSEGTA